MPNNIATLFCSLCTILSGGCLKYILLLSLSLIFVSYWKVSCDVLVPNKGLKPFCVPFLFLSCSLEVLSVRTCCVLKLRVCLTLILDCHTLRLLKRSEKVAYCKVLENVRCNSEIDMIFCLSARYG